MQLRTIALPVLIVVMTLNVGAQTGDEEQKIRTFFADSDAAWNRHNAQQLTNPQTTVPDADFINVFGGWTKGLNNFVTIMGNLQAGPFHDVARRTIVEKIRFVRSDVAVVITTNVDRRGDGPPTETRGTFVLSKEGGRWLLNSFQNTQVTAGPEALRVPAK